MHDIPLSLTPEPLTAEAYAPFGDVVSARDDLQWVPANMGTAKRWNTLCDLENARPGRAKLNVCVYRCEPTVARPIVLGLLERHPYSTQLFSPMHGTRRFLLVVSPPGSSPRADQARAFVAGGGQAISYRPGVWHHPMIALDTTSDFTCLVWEAGDSGDCEVVNLTRGISVSLND